MSYEKQTWNKYDELKTEEENIENGAVVTDNRMNHMEEGIESNDKANSSQAQSMNKHIADTANPHKVTALQVGLDNVKNFGLATEDEAKQGISNAKYMTPSLTQAVLSANINSIAHANSADGTDGFTTVYPNLNLAPHTELLMDTNNNFIWGNKASATNTITYEKVSVPNQPRLVNGIHVTQTTTGQAGWRGPFYSQTTTASIPCTPNTKYTTSAWVKNNASTDVRISIALGMSATVDQTSPTFSQNNITVPADGNWHYITYTHTTASNTNYVWPYVYTVNGTTSADFSFVGYKLEQGSTATPWMPSSSEVTTADWPKYIGFSNTVKTNKSASDYTWFPVKDSELTNKVDSHVNNKANPHSVTASQVGAYSKQEIDTKLSKAVMADDSGKVTIKSLQVETVKSNSDTDLLNLSLTGVVSATFSYIRINGIVYITAAGNWGNFSDNKQRIVGNIPAGFRPPTDWGTGMNPQGGSRLLSAVIKANGDLGVTSDAAQNNVYGQLSMSYPVI